MQQQAHLNMLDNVYEITRGQVGRMTDQERQRLAGMLIGDCIVRRGDKMPDEIGTGRIAVVAETIRAFALIADHIPSAALEFAAKQMGITDEDGVLPVVNLFDDVLSESGLGDWVIWRPNPSEPGCRVTTDEVYDQYLESLEGEGEDEMGATIISILSHMTPFLRFRRAPKTQHPIVVRRIYGDSEGGEGATGITDAERRIRIRLGLPTGEEVPAEEVAGMSRPEAEAEPASASEAGPADANAAGPMPVPGAEA